MIPGWTGHLRHLFEKEWGNLNPQMAKRLFSGCKRSLLLPTAVLSEEEMMHNIEDFNSFFGFPTEVQVGTMDILHRALDSTKKVLYEDL